jgi:hypothetical protein
MQFQVLARANRELGDRRDDPENVTLAAEVWEGVLQSIARSRLLRTLCWAFVDEVLPPKILKLWITISVFQSAAGWMYTPADMWECG